MRRIDTKKFHVATSLTAREINRRIILNVVRTRQPISRAELARHTGLQRSTVSLIADQLIQEGWIKEGDFSLLPRGRRPVNLQLNTEVQRILGINVQPSGTTLAVANLNGEFLSNHTIETVDDPKKFLSILGKEASRIIEADRSAFQGIGISLPGRIDRIKHTLVFAPNLGWKNLDFKTPMEKATGLPVDLENAANACALSEIYFGTDTREIDNLIAVTVSEGIGCGVIVNGQLMRGPHGTAGEFGHMTIDPDGPQCTCGNTGCWEVFASNRAAMRYWGELSKGNGRGAGRVRNFSDIVVLSLEGDAVARKVIERMAHFLGIGISSLVTGFAPNALVIIGDITRAWQQVAPVIEKTVKERSLRPEETSIIPADDALQPRVRGSIAIVMQNHFSAPPVA